MKKTLLVTLTGLLIGSASLHAQEGCGTGRYNSEVFTNYTLNSNVVYGTNPAASETLTLDVYQPTGDVIAQRPLIILAHGGSFISGSSTDDPAVTESCKRFAKMGYVTASINYTLGFDVLPPDSQSAARTVYTVAREMKAAVRFFRKDAATTNTYKINPNIIFIGGNSAGAILALHTGYLDQFSELPAGIDTLTAGGMEGNEFGNPGYSSEVNAIVNMAGAIGDTAWMQNNTNLPVVSAHGNADQTVPYGDAVITLGGIFPIMPVNGSGVINEFTTDHGMIADLMIFPGDDHCPWNSNAQKMTQMIIHTRDFLYPLVCPSAGTGIAPVTTFTADQTSITTGQQVSFTETCANSPYGFTWTIAPTTGVSFVGGTTASSADPVVKFNTAGTYTVILNSVNNAGSNTLTKPAYITVTGGNASVTEADNDAISVYPNPATSTLFVNWPNAAGNVTYKMVDVTGKTVLSGKQTLNGNNAIQLDVNSLSSGVYTLQLQNGSMAKTVKTVIQ